MRTAHIHTYSYILYRYVDLFEGDKLTDRQIDKTDSYYMSIFTWICKHVAVYVYIYIYAVGDLFVFTCV